MSQDSANRNERPQARCASALAACLLGAPAATLAGTNAGSYHLDLGAAELIATIAAEEDAGRDLIDIEAFEDGGDTRFAAVFRPIPGTVHELVQATPGEWQDWLTAMNLLDGHYLDFEVGYFGSVKRYSGLFVEDGDNTAMPIHSTNSDDAFQALLRQYFEEGYSLVDFESYLEPDDSVRYAGMWARDITTPPTHLFYGLDHEEFSDLLTPLAGRPLDLERYWSPLHGDYRWALLLAQVGSDNHGWGLYRNETPDSLANHHAAVADEDTFLLDLDVRTDLATPRYHAVWGKARAARAAVPPYLQPTNIEPVPVPLANAIAAFELGGEIGLEARNLRTNQTLAYQAERPFYLASVAKTAVHVRLFQHFASGHLLGGQIRAYTDGPDSRAPWFVDERSNPPLTVCQSLTQIQCNVNPGYPGFNSCHFGQSFPLSRFDQAMMQVSDNAATSLLVDDSTVGLAHDSTSLNEWLAGIDGASRGIGLLTSIHDVDRTILWQGQQTSAHAPQTSFFLVPPWAFEPLARCSLDRWGDLAAVLGVAPEELPTYDQTEGHLRYFSMGLNSASPRAWTLFLERLAEGDLLGADTAAAIGVMTEGSRLAVDPSFPNHVVVRGKGGSKGQSQDGTRVATQGNLFLLGPDTIAVSVFSNYGNWTSAQTNTRFGTIGLEILRGLSANLVECEAGSRGFSPTEALPGEAFTAWCAVTNQGGGDALPFDVTFRLTQDAAVTLADTAIGTVRIDGVPAGQSRIASLQTVLPGSLAPGNYHLAWEIDRELDPTDDWGEVGEFDESPGSHLGHTDEATLMILPGSTIFADGFE